MNLKNNIFLANLGKNIIKVVELSIYYTFLVDLYLVELFSRKYTYLIFLFTFLAGNFDSSENLNDFWVLFRFACFIFSWYLISTSIFLFIVFNIKITKNYLYDLLGEEYVKSKISNPGKKKVLQYTIPAVGLWAVDTVGHHMAVIDNRETAQQCWDNARRDIDDNPHYTDKDRNKMSKTAHSNYTKMMSREIRGPVTGAVRIEAVSESVNRVVDRLGGWLKK